jgi:hypothetical protein
MPENHWPELSPGGRAQVEAALARGNKIGAIKIYREETGVGLKEAREAIERGEPNGKSAKSGGSCAWILIAALALFLVGIVTLLLFGLNMGKQ